VDAAPAPADLVLAGGGVLGIGHVGAVSALAENGYRFERVAGTSAGSIVGSLIASGMPTARMHQLIGELDYPSFLDKDALDRVPLIGPPLSILLEDGYAEGRRFMEWLADELEQLGVTTFADLRTSDGNADRRPEHRYRLVVMAADVTRGQLLRLPWDYERYGLDPDDQPVAEAVRASISVPYLFEPYKLRYPGGESLLVDGGLLSNYPIDAFDRTDGRRPRWPTFGVTLIRQLPAGNTKLLPPVRALRLLPGFHFGESLVTTTVVGRDQGYLAQPWVAARSIEVDTFGVNPFDFWADRETIDRLYESGRRAATEFLEQWSFENYLESYRRG
jgi:NTE family protein